MPEGSVIERDERYNNHKEQEEAVTAEHWGRGVLLRQCFHRHHQRHANGDGVELLQSVDRADHLLVTFGLSGSCVHVWAPQFAGIETRVEANGTRGENPKGRRERLVTKAEQGQCLVFYGDVVPKRAEKLVSLSILRMDPIDRDRRSPDSKGL